MHGLHRPSAGRPVRIGVVALLVLVSCVSAATAAARHGGKSAAKSASAPTSTFGLSAHVSLPSTTAGNTSHMPGGPIQFTAVNSPLGAGNELAQVDLVSAGVTFTMPSFSCASNSDQEWLLPGLWIFDESGNLVAQVDVNFNCNFGNKLQLGIACIESACNTGGSGVSPNPGDVIEVSFTQDSIDGAQAIVDDRTLTQDAIATGPLTAGDTVLAGEMGLSAFGVAAVPVFTKIAFSIATVDGEYLSDNGPHTRFNLQTGSDIQIKSGTVLTTSFGTTFVHTK